MLDNVAEDIGNNGALAVPVVVDGYVSHELGHVAVRLGGCLTEHEVKATVQNENLFFFVPLFVLVSFKI